MKNTAAKDRNNPPMKRRIQPPAGKILFLPNVFDSRGAISFAEANRHIPFTIKRVYWLYATPKGKARGGHAHKRLRQVLVAISGSFDVIVDDGITRKKFHLDAPHRGLYIPAMMWRELRNFSSKAVCLVMASEYYDEKDYIREHDMFHAFLAQRR